MHSLFKTISLVNTQEIPLGKVQRISVSYISEDITLYETEGDTVILKEYFNDNDPEVFAQITADDDTISIRSGDRPLMLNFLRGYVEVYLPKSFFGVLNLKTVSGKLHATGRLVLSELAMSNTSGRIQLDGATAGNVVLSSISGSIEVGAMEALASVSTTSGSINITRAAGDGTFKSVSGSVNVNYHAVTGDITASSTSGRVRLTVPSLLSFSLDARSISGRVDVPFNGANYSGGKHGFSGNVGTGTPQVHIQLRSISGRIEVLPLS